MFKLKNFSIIFAIIAIVPPLLAASAMAQSQSIVYVDGADERAVIRQAASAMLAFCNRRMRHEPTSPAIVAPM